MAVRMTWTLLTFCRLWGRRVGIEWGEVAEDSESLPLTAGYTPAGEQGPGFLDSVKGMED